MAFCAETIEISGDFASIEGYRLNWQKNINEVEITPFGSENDYGDYIGCRKNGTLTFDTFVNPTYDTGDELTLSANASTEAWSIPVLVTGISFDGTSVGGDVGRFSTSARMTGDPSFT